MSALPYPHGDAWTISGARAKGMKPAGAVEIVLADDWHESANPTCYADQDRIYRWDWLIGLNAVLLIDAKTKLDRILADVARAEPCQIDVIDFERCLGWHVTSVKPRIRTVRWPRAWVQDWLGNGYWHKDLATAKANAIQACQSQKQSSPTFSPEVVWN